MADRITSAHVETAFKQAAATMTKRTGRTYELDTTRPGGGEPPRYRFVDDQGNAPFGCTWVGASEAYYGLWAIVDLIRYMEAHPKG